MMSAAMIIVACSKDDEPTIVPESTPNSTLQVKTGSGDGETVSYPVQVYVFQGDECKAVQTIGDEGQTLSIALEEGLYSVYAVGGASHNDYTLPTQASATPSSIVALQSGHLHGDLMTASATVSLVDGGTNTVTLGMVRKTMLIQGITISHVPVAATAVSVTIAPLHQELILDGSYDGTTGTQTIALTRQADNRTWISTDETHLLPPSSQPASISVNITIDGTTSSYTYSSNNELAAGYIISIVGSYTEAVGVTLSGTITGATWVGERTISFTFDENGSSGNGGNNGAPTVGSTYLGCYVLAVDGNEVTLMSPNETIVEGSDVNVTPALANCGVAEVTGWAVPTQVQMQLVEAKLLSDDASLNGQDYLYRESDHSLGFRRLGGGENYWISASVTVSYHLRPVAVVTL